MDCKRWRYEEIETYEERDDDIVDLLKKARAS